MSPQHQPEEGPNGSCASLRAPGARPSGTPGIRKIIAGKEGFVAFGTRKWELMRKVDELREGAPIPVLIYPSYEGVPAKDTFLACWFGWYIGHAENPNGAYPLGMKHRPPTTGKYANDNTGHWAAFWHVAALRKLPNQKCLTIGKIDTVKGGWRKDYPPGGPELVAPRIR
ncbi:hypothetical protein SAMN05519103_02587 [Rhizobiales bacterium GAS113]|nr:hypothetical protein SAMN05519103_02587 [Rhizobiales bacterium GAS113]